MSAAYDPNKLGWGAAALTCAMTAALAFTAYTIHNKTYLHPRDPMAVQVYHERDAAGGGEHGAAKHEEAGAADHKADTGAAAATTPAKH